MKRKPRQPYTVTRPIVDGVPTSFVALGKRLKTTADTASRRYRALSGPVTLKALKALDRERSKRSKRDAKILAQVAAGKHYKQLAARHGLSLQRIGQIANGG